MWRHSWLISRFFELYSEVQGVERQYAEIGLLKLQAIQCVCPLLPHVVKTALHRVAAKHRF